MSTKISIMGVDIERCTAKEAMKIVLKSMNSAPVSVFEMITGDILLHLDMVPEVKEEVANFDLLLAGETTLLDAAGITEKKYLQETHNRVFLKMFMKFLQKQHKRVYLLADTEEEMQDFHTYMQKFYSGIQIIGMSEMSAESKANDMVVNAINGAEADCVLSILSSPFQEEFIIKNKNLLNVRVWMNLGRELIPVCKKKMKQNPLTQFIVKRILQKEIEKNKKRRGN